MIRHVFAAITLLTLIVGSAGVATAQVSCWSAGTSTYCSNGQEFHRHGNTTYDNRGNTWFHLGDHDGRGKSSDRYGRWVYDGTETPLDPRPLQLGGTVCDLRYVRGCQ
jgi:hypothetical protein